jgi:peptidyl-prolyl cis-trans isomerase SurA
MELQSIENDTVIKTYLCDRIMVGNELPSRDNIEDDLHSEQMEMQSVRYLRDLRRDATIIRR